MLFLRLSSLLTIHWYSSPCTALSLERLPAMNTRYSAWGFPLASDELEVYARGKLSPPPPNPLLPQPIADGKLTDSEQPSLPQLPQGQL